MVKKIALTLCTALVASSMAMAQNRTVKGKITDANGNPIIGATVKVEGSKTVGAVTAGDGQFSISVPANSKLNVTYIGYKPQTVQVNNRTNLVIVIEEDNEQLGEVTVVAYGTKRKQDVVGSVTNVNKNIIANAQSSSVSSALEGAVAGVQVLSGSGQPGSDAAIYVRGIGSMSASNAALIVVDGVPFNGKLSDINPQDIQSISVSKDAVSNSLYGSRAAGGVVMVTTKSGSKEKVAINFRGTWGVSNRAYKDYDMATDQSEFYRLTWYGIRNTEWAAGKSLAEAAETASSSLLGELGNYNAYIVPEGEYLVNTDGTFNKNAKLRYNDSFADALFKSAFRQEYTISASGGNDRTNFYLSAGYLDNQSYVIGSSYERYTMRANVSSQLKSWLKVGTNIAYSHTKSNGVQERSGLASNPFETARGWAPIFPVHAYDAQGNMKRDENGKPIYDAGTGQTDGTSSRPTAQNQNIICSMNEDINENIYNNISTRSFIEVKLPLNFKFVTNYAYDFTNVTSNSFRTPTIGDGASFNGRGTRASGTDMTSNFNQILSYENVFNEDHNFSAKLGHEYYTYKTTYLEGQKTNFFDPYNSELYNGGQIQSLTSNSVTHNIEGYFAMADYNYAHKYYLSAAFRRDGTSRFLDRWGNFWSVGAGWRISSEKFMESTKSWLNDLKLRASYGTQGNEAILPGYYYGYTPYVDMYDVTWDGSKLGYAVAFYGNKDLSWETQKTFDLGLDFRFLDRIYGNIDFFTRRTDDMLFKRPLATSSGRPYNWENIGAMRNNGIEFELNADIIKNKDMKWTVTLLGSHYSNKVLTLPEENREDGIVSGAFKLMEGKSRYEYFTYKYAGMDEKGNPTWYTDEKDEQGNVIGQTTTGKYTEATKYWLGKQALPDFNGGLNTSFSYKGFDVNIATAFQLGGWAYDSQYLSGMSASLYVGHNRDMWDTWNPETGKGKYPIWNANNTSNSYTQTSDAHLISASYFSIRNITLGYTLPSSLMKRWGIGSIRVFATGDNLALFSKRQGFDPRVSMSGGNDDYGGYSPMRTITGGINITF
ncbi:SusC/RagA family TonB-linked outer membrane protein [Prevotella sp.]|uniref:SusC/RagA family TonB-linked outer membrane protein n=1 Tax=Prevotella sp. TaxID=59823 RepID=UPI003077C0F7